MKSILCINGWGQNPNSLENILNNIYFKEFIISSLNYVKYKNFIDLNNNHNFNANNFDIIIGWSLGGQIALRLIEKKLLKTKLLVLVASPFQFVKNSKISAGMSENSFTNFYNNFKESPSATLKKFSILTAINDKNKNQIIKDMSITESNFENLSSWLQELHDFSCFDINFNNFPQTQYFIGLSDNVVHPSQSLYFKKLINNIEIIEISNCGHAPHLCEKDFFNKKIYEKFSQI
jgi:pimeloyl-[acyl-carrier protein] methyl ester esterase